MIVLTLLFALAQSPSLTPQQADVLDRLKCQLAVERLALIPADRLAPEVEPYASLAATHHQGRSMGVDWPAGTQQATAALGYSEAQVEAVRTNIRPAFASGADLDIADVFLECTTRYGSTTHVYVY